MCVCTALLQASSASCSCDTAVSAGSDSDNNSNRHGRWVGATGHHHPEFEHGQQQVQLPGQHSGGWDSRAAAGSGAIMASMRQQWVSHCGQGLPPAETGCNSAAASREPARMSSAAGSPRRHFLLLKAPSNNSHLAWDISGSTVTGITSGDPIAVVGLAEDRKCGSGSGAVPLPSQSQIKAMMSVRRGGVITSRGGSNDSSAALLPASDDPQAASDDPQAASDDPQAASDDPPAAASDDPPAAACIVIMGLLPDGGDEQPARRPSSRALHVVDGATAAEAGPAGVGRASEVLLEVADVVLAEAAAAGGMRCTEPLHKVAPAEVIRNEWEALMALATLAENISSGMLASG